VLFLRIEMKLKALSDKKVLILGLGREGEDNLKFLRKLFPKKVLGVGDRLKLIELNEGVKKAIRADRKVKKHLGENYLKALKNYEVIVKSPGIPPKVIAPFVSKKQRVISQTEIFFENCPGKIVGVTGTKGKSTTAVLIYQILKRGGPKAYLVGNIGKPALQLLLKAKEKDVFVYELSSHQLFGLKKSPQVAVFLNVFPEHLDYYQSFKEYVKAKENITLYQGKKDYLVFNSKNKLVKEIAKKSKARKIDFSSIKVEKIIKRKDVPLKGEFNLQNVKAAICIGKIFKIPDSKMKLAIKKFKPLAHRLEWVGTFRGIEFYNDALSTIPETTIAALDALGENVQTIILGGFDRGVDFSNLATRILKSKIKTVILFPTTGKRIWETIKKEGKTKALPRHFFVDNMADAVKLCYQETKRGRICLLSTASPSFSIFKDYRQKGNLFKKYIKRYAKS